MEITVEHRYIEGPKGLVKRVRFIKVPLSRVIAKNSIDLLVEI